MPGALAGTVVSTSGGTAEDKRAAKQLVEGLGGRYSAELTQQCTHLVIKRGRTRESDKERCATAGSPVGSLRCTLASRSRAAFAALDQEA